MVGKITSAPSGGGHAKAHNVNTIEIVVGCETDICCHLLTG